MRIGVPTEIKVHEYRVGLVPAAVHELVVAGHEVAVQSGAGRGVGCSDEDYRAAGATVIALRTTHADEELRNAHAIVDDLASLATTSPSVPPLTDGRVPVSDPANAPRARR